MGGEGGTPLRECVAAIMVRPSLFRSSMETYIVTSSHSCLRVLLLHMTYAVCSVTSG